MSIDRMKPSLDLGSTRAGSGSNALARSPLSKYALVAFVGLALAALTAGCAKPAAEEAEVEANVPVRMAPVEQRTFQDSVQATGRWRAGGELIVAAPFAGVIDQIRVRPGDAVRAGETVGLITTLESSAALRGAAMLGRQADDRAARNEASRAMSQAERERVRVALVTRQSGVVVRRSAEPGTQVAEGAEILAVVPAASVVFEAHVPATQSARIHLGQSARVQELGRLPRSAAVTRILPEADPDDQSTLVWLAPSGGTLPMLERYGSAAIAVGGPRPGTAVPDSAVVVDDVTGHQRIAVVDSTEHARWIEVEVGPAVAGWRELHAPRLAAGTRLVVEGQRGLPDGAHVVPAK